MKATMEQAKKHLEELQKKDKKFEGNVVFCGVAREYVVNSKGTHLHVTDFVDECAEWEKEIFKKVEE